MDASDRHNGQRDKRTHERTDGRTEEETRLFVRPSVLLKRTNERTNVRLLDGD